MTPERNAKYHAGMARELGKLPEWVGCVEWNETQHQPDRSHLVTDNVAFCVLNATYMGFRGRGENVAFFNATYGEGQGGG